MATRFAAALKPDRLKALAGELGLTSAALVAVNVGWASRDDLRTMKASGAGWPENYPDGAYTFPECDGAGRIVGMSLRAGDGRKGSPARAAGAARGLILPATWKDRPDPVLIVEGASDVAACEVLHLPAVGRPSNSSGADDLAKLLEGRAVLVVGERDQKPGGKWPGRDGAKSVATRLATTWGKAVGWALPPEGAKDVRAWLQARVAGGLVLGDAAACKQAGAELLASLKASATEAKPEKKPSQSEGIVRLALDIFRIGRTEQGEPFAVAIDGPNVARMFRGDGQGLRATLAKEYRKRFSSTPSAAALTDALTTLEGEALDAPPEPVALRVAHHAGEIVFDLGDESGKAVMISAGKWEVVEQSPVLFRRTKLTKAMLEPVSGGSMELLRDLLNVAPHSWPVLVGWLVSAFFPEMPHPILMIGGQQGTGKSTAARIMLDVIDPSTAPLRSQPRDPESWAVAASGSWAICIDNVSTIPDWWSDALCKAVTGDGWVGRRRYTDSDISVLKFHRVVMLTSIDAGALRGDLGDRLLLMDLEPIGEAERRAESELNRLFAECQPLIFGALLDIVADVLPRLNTVKLSLMSRMADFCRVLAAMDAAKGGDGSDGLSLPLYFDQRNQIASDVVEGDVVGCEIVALADREKYWQGTPGALLKAITPAHKPREWPANPRKLTAWLNRLIPSLRSVRVVVTMSNTRTNAGRIITIENRGGEPSQPSQRSSDHAGQVGGE